MYDILYMKTHIAKVSTMVKQCFIRVIKCTCTHVIHYSDLLNRTFLLMWEPSATLKLICENTNCRKERYSPLSLAGTLHRVE